MGGYVDLRDTEIQAVNLERVEELYCVTPCGVFPIAVAVSLPRRGH